MIMESNIWDGTVENGDISYDVEPVGQLSLSTLSGW